MLWPLRAITAFKNCFLYFTHFFHPCLLFPTCLFFIQKCFSAHVLYSKHVYQSTVNSHVTRFWKILREPEPHCPPFTSVPCLIFGIVSISLIYQKRYQITNLPNKPWCNCKNNLSEFLKMMLISVFSDVNKYILIKNQLVKQFRSSHRVWQLFCRCWRNEMWWLWKYRQWTQITFYLSWFATIYFSTHPN